VSQSLDAFATSKLAEIDQRNLRRTLIDTDRQEGAFAIRNGRRLISFSCNDYLDLSHHPAMKRAAAAAIEKYGVGAGASRLVTGNHPLFAELEGRLARLKGTDDAVVFGSGYLANVGIIPCLVGPGDLVLADEWSHACLMAGASLSRATQLTFRHNDLDHCAELLSQHRGSHQRCLIVTDGVFSMDGDLAPVDALVALATEHDAWLMTDDAHGIGVLGGGRGSSFISGQRSKVPLQMGTLSKAIGGYGGYLCASQAVIDLIRNRARSLIYSTGLPPAGAAAAIAALDLIEADPEWAASPVRKARQFALALNLPEPESCIVPIIIGDETATLDASQALEAQGFLVAAIRPPTVPKDTARLRFTFSAAHTDDQIARIVDAVRGLNLAAEPR
jgi:8-amino-7-oxononanoate synthase